MPFLTLWVLLPRPHESANVFAAGVLGVIGDAEDNCEAINRYLFMSEFLSRIKARLETGQHYNLSYSEESGTYISAPPCFC